MKLIIFGATGGTGRAVVRQALAEGHEVTAFVRDPAKLGAYAQHERLRVVQGDVTDAARVEQVVEGADAVISALGPTRASAKDMLRAASTNIIAAMKKHGVRRLIWQTGAGVRDEGDQPSAIRIVMIMLLKLFSPQVLEDSERTFQNIKASDLEWTVVRVPALKDGPKQGGYRAGVAPPSPIPLAREDVAEFVLKQLSDNTDVHRAPMIGY